MAELAGISRQIAANRMPAPLFLTNSLEVKSFFLIEADNQRVSHVPSVQGVLEYVKAYLDALHKMCGINNEIFCRSALDMVMKLLTLLERSQYGALYGLEVITANQKRKPQ